MKNFGKTFTKKKYNILFDELKKFVESWGEFKDLSTIEDKVFFSLFYSFIEGNEANQEKRTALIIASYPEANAIYRIIKIILQNAANDNFEAFAASKNMSVVNGAWCYTETGQEFDFETEELPKPTDSEIILKEFLIEFQKYLVG